MRTGRTTSARRRDRRRCRSSCSTAMAPRASSTVWRNFRRTNVGPSTVCCFRRASSCGTPARRSKCPACVTALRRQRLCLPEALRAHRRRPMAAPRPQICDACNRPERSRRHEVRTAEIFAMDRRPRPRDLFVELRQSDSEISYARYFLIPPKNYLNDVPPVTNCRWCPLPMECQASKRMSMTHQHATPAPDDEFRRQPS